LTVAAVPGPTPLARQAGFAEGVAIPSAHFSAACPKEQFQLVNKNID
jgi:hypothetical protein